LAAQLKKQSPVSRRTHLKGLVSHEYVLMKKQAHMIQ
jgi:hypothetical protein